jgi:pimeloyl-ACP methyl ester carboxylesterase
MDPSFYKTTTVSRGFTYHYYASPAQEGRATLLFCHGFPSTADDWRRVVPYFKEQGYGIIAPDMIGYGGTDKPTDPAVYVGSGTAKDLVDILDAENIDNVIAIGHDWGSRAVSRLAAYYPERVIAYAFLAVPYQVPQMLRGASFEQFIAQNKELLGTELFGYWLFFSEPNAHEIMEKHIDALASVLFPHNPEYWKTRLAPVGALKASCLEDFKAPLPSYLSNEELEDWKSIFLKNGFAGPTCWYKVVTSGLEDEDGQQVPPDRIFPPKTAPLFFGACTKDYVCHAEWSKHFMREYLKEHDVTICDFESHHWAILGVPGEVCKELGTWIENTVSRSNSVN